MEEKILQQQAITNELLAGVLNMLYSLELLLADAHTEKINLRYSNATLNTDEAVLTNALSLVKEECESIIRSNDGKGTK